jgi:adenylate kinase
MGQTFAGYGKTGSLVPDELTVELWRQTIAGWVSTGRFDPSKQILLLDGIPRTLEQAELMDANIDVLAIIYLVCNDIEQIVTRLRKRAEKDNRPDDTNEEVIRHRLDVYEEQTRPVLEFYPRRKIFRVNATQDQEKVTGDILKALEFLKG